ncbi:hypothetical protein ACFSHP_24970 [Novosphingobium panipatense]
MVPGLVLCQVDLLYTAVPVPSYGGEVAVQLFDRAALGVAQIEIAIDQSPLDTIPLGQITLFGVEDIDVPGPCRLRIPADDATLFIDKAHDLPAVGLPSEPYDAIVRVPGNAETSDVAVEAHHLPCSVEAAHMFFDIGEACRGKDREPAVFGCQPILVPERFADLAVDDEARGVVEHEDVGARTESGLSLTQALTTIAAMASLSVTVVTLSRFLSDCSKLPALA